MLAILKSEIERLRREESGVALMLTLSVFLLLYVVCAGVYSVGETVRQKIELQNACDNAAYSAAVVQADGLSRIAMVNRAMAWTYIQLTNMQIDYITWKWLKEVAKRFREDESMCREFNREGTDVDGGWAIGIGPIPEPHHCRGGSHFTDPGYGYFCGAGGKHGYVRLNNREPPVPIENIEEIGNSKEFERYGEMIDQFKTMIAAHEASLNAINAKMNSAMSAAAFATLVQNLPRRPKEEPGGGGGTADWERDSELAEDFLGYVDAASAMDPYHIEDGELVAGGYFSPLYNTELDERLFLSMADGEVHDNLVDYFGVPEETEDGRRCGGLDQWFVRGWTNDTFNSTSRYFPKSDASVKHIGIRRVYRNANLMGNVDFSDGGYRAHHCGLGDKGCKPSCLQTHENWPEQCRTVPNSIGLCADYEWSSGQYEFSCYHIDIWDPKEDWHRIHTHSYRTKFLPECRKQHNCPQTGSHSREEYKSCWSHGKHLEVPFTDMDWPPILDAMIWGCHGELIVPGVAEALAGALSVVSGDFNLGSMNGLDYGLTERIVTYSNRYEPNGFARIYGDDKELVDEHYVGEEAHPWVLNSLFYGRDGAIVVGLARRQRNPWTFLLNAVADVISGDRTGEEGVYSAFNPVANGYLTAFSAARAAHRYHPSPSARAWADAHVAFKSLGDPGEYETRYDAVCDDEARKFSLFRPDGMPDEQRELYDELRVGCVCWDDDNANRFARCWNLCETDWDATLLPVRYAWAPVEGEFYDSYRDDQGKPNEVTWQSAGFDEIGRNPLEVARDGDVVVDESGEKVKERLWMHLADWNAEDNREPRYETGEDILEMIAPFVADPIGVRRVNAPYGPVEIEDAERREDAGKLDLGRLIYSRIL